MKKRASAGSVACRCTLTRSDVLSCLSAAARGHSAGPLARYVQNVQRFDFYGETQGVKLTRLWLGKKKKKPSLCGFSVCGSHTTRLHCTVLRVSSLQSVSRFHHFYEMNSRSHFCNPNSLVLNSFYFFLLSLFYILRGDIKPFIAARKSGFLSLQPATSSECRLKVRISAWKVERTFPFITFEWKLRITPFISHLFLKIYWHMLFFSCPNQTA